jgi:hypothetical protein
MLGGVLMRILGKREALRAYEGAQDQRDAQQTLCRSQPSFRRKHPEESASIPQLVLADKPTDAATLRQVTRNQEVSRAAEVAAPFLGLARRLLRRRESPVLRISGELDEAGLRRDFGGALVLGSSSST